ncbi:hypothetical protein [Streptomyces sp. V3I8]|uniref:hypothetical protein n=1 Tax=Streptomyces sp. V3I8 TaxID=3042279 RepID=UPI0027D88A13|nr:hypothetical protein [Streptomyces sp. V3I8]
MTYQFAEVTLLDPETSTPIDTQVFLEPNGGAPQEWPVLFDPAVIDLWLDTPQRVTVLALLPGGSTLTRTGVDVSPAPAATVRTEAPLHIGSAEGLSSQAVLAVSPDGSAVWQSLDVLRDHRHEGDSPDSTVLGMLDLQDIYPGQTWLGPAISGEQGPDAAAMGYQAHPGGAEATAVGRAAGAGARGTALGADSSAGAEATALGANSSAGHQEQVVAGRNTSAAAGPPGAVVLGAQLNAEALASVRTPGVRVYEDGRVVLGQGVLPDMSWADEAYTAILGSAVVPKFFGARNDATMAGRAQTLGFFGASGQTVPLLSTSSVAVGTPGRDALLSLMSALDRMELIHLTDGAIDDELADFTKSFAHNANAVIETGADNGTKPGETSLVKRNAAGPATLTYRIANGIRDFRSRVFVWSTTGSPASPTTELVADVSPDNTTWTRVPLSWQPLIPTTDSWNQCWAANQNPLPAGTQYLRLTLDNNPAIFTPMIGRVIVRPIGDPVLTTTVLANPSRLQVSDNTGVLATLTVGAKTVAMRGPQRTFTESKRPFTDPFDRTTSDGWGVSPEGGTWSHANGADTDYSVSGGLGRILVTDVNASRHTSLVDNVTDVDARLSWSLSAMPTGNASSLGLSFGYTSSTSHYRARMSVLTSGSVQLALECQTSGGTTTLGALTTIGTGYVVGDVWHIRAQRTGTSLRCRAWKDGTAEPSTWTHQVSDATLGAGRVGLRALASTGSTAVPFTFNVHDVQVYSGTWPDPPSVTHTTWVRTLAQPFSGTWTPALAAQILAWGADTSADALAFAMRYITGAPVITSPGLGGAQVAGQAKYGPDAADGTRIEGADFHDYMARDWTFPNGETLAANPAEPLCMDCSGYVRMVYGYNMGIPMVRTANLNGTNLPRMTKDIGPSGPGIIVAQATNAPPSLTSLQIGDVPHFDADTSDLVAGQMDHNGIYLGLDNHGVPRFINSRKTPNGPTFGDLGGTSTLTGEGLYATSLRIIRRF